MLTDDTRPEEIVWEEGANRRLPVLAPADGDGAVLTDDAPRIAMRPWRGAGVVIPVFSLRSEGSQGVGDFGDLSTLARHAPRAGLAAIQILPVGDTTSTGTWRDSYPYNGISVFALHPIYFDMRRHRASAAYARHAGRAAELNRLPALDYEAVFALKTAFLHDLYTETGTAVERSTEYRRFVAEEAYWLAPYARYSLRKAEEQGRSTEGGEAFYRFVQYGLHRQLSAAHEIARRAGVILKGDIPIGICRDSVDAETYPALFHMDGQAGAPPDAFARLGQNWGFPTYDWEAMSADGYGWWRKRLAHMNRYFDAFRIDHVLGFFRIWEVPADQAHGLLGRFRPALPLSEEEIRQAGFGPSPAYYATPRITEAALLSAERDGELKAIRRYLDREADGTYVLRPEVGTQRRIEHALPPGALRTALMNLCTEVLFIPDPDRPGHYHPRIAAGDTEAFRSLSPADREAWGRLHDDFFYRRHDAFWAEQAMRKLPAILSRSSAAEHHMLPCAEDLGMVPASVKGVLERLEVLSLEIQRMPKRYGVRFDRVEDNPYLSVATIATHDMPPCACGGSRTASRRPPSTAKSCTAPHRHRPRPRPRCARPSWRNTSNRPPCSASWPCRTGSPSTPSCVPHTPRKSRSTTRRTPTSTGITACTSPWSDSSPTQPSPRSCVHS